MRITDDQGTLIVDPSPSQIRDLIMALTREGESFAILDADAQNFIQISGTVAEGFVLEYREGADDRHFGVYEPRLSADEVAAAFLEYAESRDGYKTRYSWEKTP